MAKRVFLFLATNFVIFVTLSILLNVLGVGRYITPSGQVDLGALAGFCLVWGMGGALLSLQLSRWTAKRAMGVRLVDGATGNADLDWLHNTVANLTRQANLPMPEVGFYESPEINAFATGPSKRRSLVAVSSGLLASMQRNEIEGVLGHEISHVANGDMVTMTLLQGVINAFVMFVARVAGAIVRSMVDRRIARFVSIVVVIGLDIALGFLGSMITAWFSRQREFRADAGGASLAGQANMTAALRRLLANQQRVDVSNAALATFKIAGKGAWLRAFSTHPPLEERIAALESGRTT